MGGKRNLFSNWLLYCFFLCTFALLVCGSAIGQEEKEEFSLEAIVVTGSRIARNNNESVSPIVTVDEKLFDNSATSAIETQLNKLPQFTPTIDIPQIGGQDIQPTARNTPGEATVALRGIGANRTMVLINSRRGTPSNASGVLDINTIPTAAIEYVEAISGGASSTYGADAMAGVLNFIMKDTFEGFEIDFQSGITQEWDNFEYQISGIMGSNIADDRGNVMMAFSYNDRDEAMMKDRSWFRKNWRDPTIAGTMFFPPYTGYGTGYDFVAFNFPSTEAINSAMGNGVNFTGLPFGATFYYDPVSDSVISGFSDQDRAGVPAARAAGLIDGYVIKELANGNISMNNVDSYLIYPMDRFNMFTQGNYKINDYIGVFGQAYFSKVHAETVQEPGIITTGWGVQVDPNTHRESIPAGILAITDSRPNPDAPIDLFALLPFNRVGLTDTFTFNMTAGLEGELPSIGWTWEAFVSHGEAETTSRMKGFLSLERTRTIMELPEFGRGAVIKGNQYPGSPGFGTVEATCASGLNPFDWASVTPDCWTAVKAEVKSKMLMEQNIYEANSQGRIMDLPGGEMRGALGVSYRENNYYFLSDTVNSAGTSFNDQILGLYPSADSYGSIEAKEGYAELLVPLLKDLPFMKQVDLSLGGRRSDYDTTGTSYTYKAMLDWKTLDFLRFRGGYARAERAPNIAELYLAPENAFGFSGYGDVCSLKNGAVNSANPTNNPENWMNVVSVCGQMMEAVNPDEAQDDRYYGLDYASIVAYGNANAITISPNATAEEKTAYLNTYRTAMGISDQDWSEIPAAGGSFLWPVTYGNPNLDPEKADTWTFGFVLDSFIDDIPALMDWRVSVDYYSIKVKDAIGEQTGDIVMRQCVDPAFNPTFDPNSPYCAGIIRNPDGGGLQTLYRTFFNNGRFETSGIDLQVNWGMDAGPGHVTVTSLFNYLIDMKSSELATDPLKEYAGTFGPSENGLNGNSVEYRALTTVGYSWKDIEAAIRWQYTSRVKQVSGTTTGFPSYNMFDLTGSYQLMDNVRIRFGCENIFNKRPPLYGVDYSKLNEGEDGMTGGSYSYYLSDVNGRRFYVGAKVYF